MAQIMYKNPGITTTYTGRNGDGKCIGIIVQDRITAGGEKAGVILSPINSKGNQANCYINIPPEDVKAVAIALLNSIGESVSCHGAPKPKSDVIHGTFVSEWSDGTTIETPATLNTKTGKLDVEMSDDDGDHGSLEREYFTDTNDKEYEVCSCCHEYITKTEMVDDEVGNGQHEETRCLGDCE